MVCHRRKGTSQRNRSWLWWPYSFACLCLHSAASPHPASDIFIFIYCVFPFYLYVCLCTMYVQCPWKPESGVRSSATEVTEGSEIPCDHWELNPDPARTASAFNCLAILTVPIALSHALSLSRSPPPSFVHLFVFSVVYWNSTNLANTENPLPLKCWD